MLNENTIDLLANALATTEGFRVLRRLNLEGRSAAANDDCDTTVGVVIDVETTGVDPSSDRIIELALRRFRYDRNGAITKLDRPFSWLEDPGEPLDPAIIAITGLTDADLAGRAIDESHASVLIRSADVCIAHNARFDRRFVERRLPAVTGLAWACSLDEVDWRGRGFDGSGRSLPWLLAQAGFFHGAHRAGSDVDATIAILRHVADGRSAFAELIARASRPTWSFAAVGANYGVKDRLRARGYRWNGDDRVWTREVADTDRVAEETWLADNVYPPECTPRADGPSVREVTWLTRHA